MLVTATPLIKSRGIPPPAYLERVRTSPSMTGMRGLGIDWGWLQNIGTTALSKIEIPGFGTPLVAPGTTVRTETGYLQRQTEGYPVYPGGLDLGLKTQTDTGSALIIAAGAVVAVVLVVVMSRKGGGK